MKKLYPVIFSLLFFILFTNDLFSQITCIPDTNNYAMITPESDSLPCVERNVPYRAVLQLFCPPQIASIDMYSIVISSFSGFPTGINYACSPINCTIMPWDHACIVIEGTTSDTVGDYKINYTGTASTAQGNASFSYLQGLGFIPEYQLKVIEQGDPCRDAVNTGIRKVTSESGTQLQIYPNPSNRYFHINAYNDKMMTGQLSVCDMMGQTIFTQELGNVKVLNTSIDLSAYPKGIYTVLLKTNRGVSTAKISLN